MPRSALQASKRAASGVLWSGVFSQDCNGPDHGNVAAFRARPWPNPKAPCAVSGFAFAGYSITLFFSICPIARWKVASGMEIKVDVAGGFHGKCNATWIRWQQQEQGKNEVVAVFLFLCPCHWATKNFTSLHFPPVENLPKENFASVAIGGGKSRGKDRGLTQNLRKFQVVSPRHCNLGNTLAKDQDNLLPSSWFYGQQSHTWYTSSWMGMSACLFMCATAGSLQVEVAIAVTT